MSQKSQELRDMARRIREIAQHADRTEYYRKEMAEAEELDKEADRLEGKENNVPAPCVHCQSLVGLYKSHMPTQWFIRTYHARGCPVRNYPDINIASSGSAFRDTSKSDDRQKTLNLWKEDNK